VEALNNTANGFSIQITALADLPKVYEELFVRAGFNQPLDGVGTTQHIRAASLKLTLS
jgi:hypothetical protein